MNTAVHPDAVIEAYRLGKDFAGRKVLDGVSLAIEPGQILGLVGRNGAGKTTLLRCLLGLLRPDRGESRVFGTPSLQLRDTDKAALAYVSQQPDSFEWMRIDELLHFISTLYPAWDTALAEHLLQLWNLPPNARLNLLSPGQRQQVALIRALAARPRLLVLDEPAAALDPVARRDLLREIVACASEQNTTVIFSTHIISDLERVASHIAFLHQGQLRVQASLDDLKEQVRRVTLPAGYPPLPPLNGELARRRLANGSWSLLLRNPTPETASHCLPDAAIVHSIGLEDLFVELAE